MAGVDELIRLEMKVTNHKEVCFPLLIPESLFNKEAEHIEGFGSEVYWITHAGFNELEERWLLRPTSETAMYPVFSLWIRSHADLPLKTFQIVNTFRYETKQTRAFIRVREIHFFEAHTCHIDFSSAEEQVAEDKEIAHRFLKKLCLPFVLHKRPEWDKFAGAYYTISIDVLMPSGRTLQLGSIHQYRDNFAKPYEIKYEAEDGSHVFCHQTTFGMSERILGSIIGIHGDSNGLILPPAVAPTQVVIIPIIFKDKKEEVLKACEDLAQRLMQKGIRVHSDKREITPGNKFYDWELKGVPIRIEIGPRDIENNQVTVVARDNGNKQSISNDDADTFVIDELNQINDRLFKRADELLTKNLHIVSTVDDAEKLQGIIQLPWCGEDDCALSVEESIGKNTLGEPVDSLKEISDETCPICGKQAKKWMRYAKTY
jgi:prolyl-tRNA synthetase